MQLISKRGEFTFAYTVTSEDAITLLRAVEHEGSVKAHTAAVLVNYFMALGAYKIKTYPTLEKLIKDYAVPINPAWFVGGEKYNKKLANLQADKKSTASLNTLALSRPAQAETTEFNKNTQAAVVLAFKGNEAISAFPHATDYAARDKTDNPLSRGFIQLYSAGPHENNLWWNPKLFPDAPTNYTSYINIKPEDVEGELTAWSLLDSGGDVNNAIARIRRLITNKKLGAGNKVAYTTHGNVTPYVSDANGTSAAALGGKALQVFLAKQRRAWQMAGTTWQSFHGESAAEAEAAEVATVIKTTKLVAQSEAVLSLPIVVNALGFDPATGEWVRRTNTTTIKVSTAPQPTVPSETAT